METLDERFRSRFEWGLIADIQPPDYETRMAILRKNAEMYDKEIDDEIIQYIATNIKSNIRELEGALNKVMANARLNKQELNLALAEDALKDVIYPDQVRELTPALIIDVVAEHFNIPKMLVKKWIAEGRVEYKEQEEKIVNLHCSVCGETITFGTLCQKCYREKYHTAAGFVPLQLGEKSKMRFLEKDNPDGNT